MVEDLEALRRGGRIPGSVAYAGSKLDVKPLLTIAPDGKLSLAGVARGRKKGIKQLAEYYQKRVAEKRSRPAAWWWRTPTARRTPSASRRRWRKAGRQHPVLGEQHRARSSAAHVGPGMIAVVFWGGDKREEHVRGRPHRAQGQAGIGARRRGARARIRETTPGNRGCSYGGAVCYLYAGTTRMGDVVRERLDSGGLRARTDDVASAADRS